MYSARFHFIETSDDTGPHMLEVQFSRCGGTGDLEISEKKWYRGPKEQPPLEINHFNLERFVVLYLWHERSPLMTVRKSGWQLQISAANSIDDSNVKVELRGLVDHLMLKAPNKETGLFSKEPFRFPRGSTPIRKWEIKTAFRYKLQNSAYRFELAMHQTLQMGSNADRKADVVPAVRWGASLYNQEWDEILSQQSSLDVGECGTWPARLNTFFSSKGASVDSKVDTGFQDFVSRLETVSKLVSYDDEVQISELPSSFIG